MTLIAAYLATAVLTAATASIIGIYHATTPALSRGCAHAGLLAMFWPALPAIACYHWTVRSTQ